MATLKPEPVHLMNPPKKTLILLDADRLHSMIAYLEGGAPPDYPSRTDSAQAQGYANDLLSARRMGLGDREVDVIIEALELVGDSRRCDDLSGEEIAAYRQAGEFLKMMRRATSVVVAFAGINFRDPGEIAETKAALLDSFMDGAIDGPDLRTRTAILEALIAFRTF